MHPRSRPSAVLRAAAVLALSACAPSVAPGPQPAPEEEQVGTGYGTERRATSTAAVSSLAEDDMPRGGNTTLVELLDRVPGVTVNRRGGGQFTVRVRGSRTFAGSDEPLFVVDGMPRTLTSLEAIAPSSIVRIELLKDAGTLAGYGARGANGVILITTRDAP
ncbi:TonB-dependent receptor plug domain-containing protein [Longimicrobium terrae]|uniref:TonB-dependent SusC/RagA subfamily outer membrane receptor n=1 Tax=Longimicrobium terrae TaxID=1639882 RepID=A0A841H3I0_9BACT|nr:TonB-dependent receptor plug domain-containing protein [Longimicrobium terrae]MBB4638486.1 TonB-dependent SusC/RagA subfamily outer membrane receptor [Longimicrobium terrae]MBB6072671.1 TonB-dependent SusC/RagA subfamily outer membrane receptor [Longimicrobium terrae]NNC32453.1 TonB-dependent receptor plug domain-containing protein [Longimicrobium terrae]